MNKALVRRAVSVVHLDAKMTKSKIVLCVPYDTRIHMLLGAMKQRFCAIEAFSSQAQLNLAGSDSLEAAILPSIAVKPANQC